MDADGGVVAPVVIEVQRPRPQGVLRTAGHAVGVFGIGAGVAFDHVVGRPPAGPFDLAADRCFALPDQFGRADGDAVADRLARCDDVIQEEIAADDDDAAGLEIVPDLDLDGGIGIDRRLLGAGQRRGQGGCGHQQGGQRDHLTTVHGAVPIGLLFPRIQRNAPGPQLTRAFGHLAALTARPPRHICHP